MRQILKAVPLFIVLVAAFSGGEAALAQAERVLGLDVSYWNRGSSSATASGITQTAWDTAYDTPNANGYTRHFVWVRASRGGTTGLSQGDGTPGNPSPPEETLSRRYDDPEFLRTMTRATTAGMFAGAYHFGRPDLSSNTGTDEADHFIEYASAYMRPGYLMPVFDLEAGSGTGGDALAQFSIDFSNRLYDRMRIRPAMYINGNYSGIIQGANQSRRDQLAKPATASPSVVGPAYPMLWDARYSDNDNPEAIPVQTGSPRTTYTISSGYYGPWDDYGDATPWSFWQYASTIAVPGISDTTLDGNVAHGDIEYVKNYLVPAVWWHDASGDWNTLANWNSGQPLSTFNASDINNPPAPYVPHVGEGQTTPFASYTLPAPRLPGASGSGSTSGQHDTVILERPSASIVVTHTNGTHKIRKLYMRETLSISGGSLTVNYDPTYRPDDSADVLHGGPISAQFSGPVTLSGGTFSVHTLQVDTNQTFTLAGGTLTLHRINLMPRNSTPAKIVFAGNMTFSARSNVTAVIAKGAGSGSSGLIDLGGATRSLSVVNGTNDIDLSIEVPISNGGLTKAASGTLRLTSANTYAGGTIISAGRLMVNNTTGSGTGTGTVAVTNGTLCGTGIIGGAVTVYSGGTIAPGTTTNTGTLTLSSAPTFAGTNFIRINRNAGSPLSDKLALSSGTLTYGGTLVVTNTGAALTGGEVFTIFSAPTYSGTFANFNMPTLGSGLNWFTGALVTNGTIRVNRRPITSPVTFTNTAPSTLEIPFATLIGSATDADGNALQVTAISPTTTNGTALTTNGTSIFYSHHATVTDQFNYTISDGQGGTATGFVNIQNIGSTPMAQFTTSPNANGNSVSLAVQGTPGWTYYMDRATNLLGGWVTISTNVAPQSGVFNVVDGFGDLSNPPASAYYRLRWSGE